MKLDQSLRLRCLSLAQRPDRSPDDALEAARKFEAFVTTGAPRERVVSVASFRAYLKEQITHVQQRIEDGKSEGASIWRLALEDVVREHQTQLLEMDKLP